VDKLNPDAIAGKQHEGGKALDQLVVAGGDAVGCSASGLREAVRRLEEQLGVRLLHRTTRSVAPTEVGQRLLDRLGPALTEVEAALDVVNSFRDRPAGTLRLNVPVSAARLVEWGAYARQFQTQPAPRRYGSE
jgi:DNA-binding transcriptional LysR family regulator